MKLENVLISRSGHIKIADFGLAYYGYTPFELIQENAVCGTLFYMAPEVEYCNKGRKGEPLY